MELTLPANDLSYASLNACHVTRARLIEWNHVMRGRSQRSREHGLVYSRVCSNTATEKCCGRAAFRVPPCCSTHTRRISTTIDVINKSVCRTDLVRLGGVLIVDDGLVQWREVDGALARLPLPLYSLRVLVHDVHEQNERNANRILHVRSHRARQAVVPHVHMNVVVWRRRAAATGAEQTCAGECDDAAGIAVFCWVARGGAETATCLMDNKNRNSHLHAARSVAARLVCV
jgi:hypothetical protein